MRKIKRFKITLRLREIIRLLRTTANVSDITPQLEDEVKREKTRLENEIKPQVIYETQPKENINYDLGVEAPAGWVAATFYCVSLGKEVETQLEKPGNNPDDILSKILHAAFLEALEQSANFTCRLIKDEAEADSCEVSDRVKVTSFDALKKILEVLAMDKISVHLLDSMEFEPRYTGCGVVFWVPVKKRKNSPSK